MADTRLTKIPVWMVYANMSNSSGWTTKPPTEEGWYWAYSKPNNKIVKDEPVIVKFKPGLNWVEEVGSDYGTEIEKIELWLGPLPMPEPLKTE